MPDRDSLPRPICSVDQFSSAVCVLGTKSCTVDHQPREAWNCPICGRLEDGTGPCAHTGPPKQNAELSWLREDLKKAGEQIKRYEAGR
jgi:hypothetical protein